MRPFSLGWHPIDPGPGPMSPLLDAPPTPDGSDYAIRYGQWRHAVELDTQRLDAHHQSGQHWHPLPLPSGIHFLPVFGGRPEDLEQVVTTLVISSIESDLDSCRVVDLTGWDLSGSLRGLMANARRNRAEFEQVAPNATTANLFANPDADELIGLLADALRVTSDRTGGRRSQQDRQELEKIARMLATPVTLDRLLEAIDVALGSSATPTSLDLTETRQLRDYHASVVSQRRATQDRLSDLHVDLDSLRTFQKAAGRSGSTYGTGRLALRWYDVPPAASVAQMELGRELLTRSMLQQFASRGRAELLVVLGAEYLAEEVRSGLTQAAQRLGKWLALVFTRLEGPGEGMLGHAGSSLSLILRLPNPADATLAAEFIGREYKFVVNGISIADGTTEEWSTSYGTNVSRGTSHSTSRTSTHGMSGWAFNFSSAVGSSVTSSYSRSTSTSASSGRSVSNTRTSSQGRVHEYVLEPEVFQQMPDGMMFVVFNGSVTVASCQNRLRRSRSTSLAPVELQ